MVTTVSSCVFSLSFVPWWADGLSCEPYPDERAADSADGQHHDELAQADLVVVLRSALQVLQAVVDVGVFPLLSQVDVGLVQPLLELVLGHVALIPVVDALEDGLARRAWGEGTAFFFFFLR